MSDEKVRRLFLCRHGKTESNENGIYCGGKSDSPLTEKGREQAKLLGKALGGYYKFSGRFIISSAKGRAVETAEIISQCIESEPMILKSEGLHEIDLGKWCGKKMEEIQKLFPKEHREWHRGYLRHDFTFPNGESIGEAGEKRRKCFDIIKKMWLSNGSENNTDLIVVAHGGTNILILTGIISGKMNKFAYRSLRQDNACVNIIGFREKKDWHPEVQILLVNDTHHLDCELR